MAKPTGALDVTSDTTDPLSIDLEQWNLFDPENGTDQKPIYMYCITRAAIAPGEIMFAGDMIPAHLRVGMSTAGDADEPARFWIKLYRDRTGNIKSIGEGILEAGEAEWITCRTGWDWSSYPYPGSALRGPIQMGAMHGRITGDQGAFLWLGFWNYFYAEETDPTACDRVDWECSSKDPSEGNYPASAWDMMSRNSLSMNTYTYMVSGGFGSQVFACPVFGYPEPV